MRLNARTCIGSVGSLNEAMAGLGVHAICILVVEVNVALRAHRAGRYRAAGCIGKQWAFDMTIVVPAHNENLPTGPRGSDYSGNFLMHAQLPNALVRACLPIMGTFGSLVFQGKLRVRDPLLIPLAIHLHAQCNHEI